MWGRIKLAFRYMTVDMFKFAVGYRFLVASAKRLRASAEDISPAALDAVRDKEQFIANGNNYTRASQYVAGMISMMLAAGGIYSLFAGNNLVEQLGGLLWLIFSATFGVVFYFLSRLNSIRGLSGDDARFLVNYVKKGLEILPEGEKASNTAEKLNRVAGKYKKTVPKQLQ